MGCSISTLTPPVEDLLQTVHRGSMIIKWIGIFYASVLKIFVFVNDKIAYDFIPLNFNCQGVISPGKKLPDPVQIYQIW